MGNQENQSTVGTYCLPLWTEATIALIFKSLDALTERCIVANLHSEYRAKRGCTPAFGTLSPSRHEPEACLLVRADYS